MADRHHPQVKNGNTTKELLVFQIMLPLTRQKVSDRQHRSKQTRLKIEFEFARFHIGPHDIVAYGFAVFLMFRCDLL
jgi:hypothetical protein